MITIVLPTHNEAAIIAVNLDRLRVFLDDHVHEEWRIIVADNGSTDATRAIVRAIATRDPRVELLEIPETGKGHAVCTAWTRAARSASPDDVFTFMDADLATNLRSLPALIAAVRTGADVAVGSRVLPGATVERGIFRRLLAWGNRCILRCLFDLPVSDPPCGFKAVRVWIVHDIVPRIRDMQWFFDTELLIHAQRAGLRIAEIPVRWREPRRGGSLCKVLRIANSDLRAIARLRHEFRHEFRAH